MKKLLAILISMTMIFSLVACGGSNNEPEPVNIVPEFTEGTAGETLWNAFATAVAENEAATPEELATLLSTNSVIPFMCGAAPVEPGYLAGFDADITGFESGAAFCPMIGSIAFAGYVFELAKDADVTAFVDTLKANANPAWNICVSADYVQAGALGNKVYFLMYPASMDEAENISSDPAVIIFPTVEEGTWGDILWNEFLTVMDEDASAPVTEIANAVAMHESIPFMAGAAEVAPGYLAGFDVEIDGFKSGASFGPMMSSIAFVGYVFELEDDADLDAFLTKLSKNSNPRWQMCVTADQTVIGAYNNTVFFLMCPNSNGSEK